jgi:hypothetical protein
VGISLSPVERVPHSLPGPAKGPRTMIKVTVMMLQVTVVVLVSTFEPRRACTPLLPRAGKGVPDHPSPLPPYRKISQDWNPSFEPVTKRHQM